MSCPVSGYLSREPVFPHWSYSSGNASGRKLSLRSAEIAPVMSQTVGQEAPSVILHASESLDPSSQTTHSAPSSSISADHLPPAGRYLVVLNEAADPAQVAKDHGIDVKEGDILSGVNILVTRLTPDLVEALKKDKRIEFLEEDKTVSDRSVAVVASEAKGVVDQPDRFNLEKPLVADKRADAAEGSIGPSVRRESEGEESGGKEKRYLLGVKSDANIKMFIEEFKLKVERSMNFKGFYAELSVKTMGLLLRDPRFLFASGMQGILVSNDGDFSRMILFFKQFARFLPIIGLLPGGMKKFPPLFRPQLPNLPPISSPPPRPSPPRRPEAPQRPTPPPPGPPSNEEIRFEGQVIPMGIDRIDAEQSRKTGRGVGIAILDTGIDLFHPDLASNIKGGASFIPDEPTVQDYNGHGTHVAGIIAAADNNIGVRGVAPEAGLYGIKVLDRYGSGSVSGVIRGVNYVAANADRIQLANMSLGAPDVNFIESRAMQTSIRRAAAKGTTFVVAAGNEGQSNYSTIPAAFPEAITVTALVDTDGKPGGLGASTRVGGDDQFASFSNFGKAEIAAPGVNILSTLLGGGYGRMSGTSQAAPHVTGVAALYLQGRPDASPSDVKEALVGAATRSGLSHYATVAQSSQHPEPVLTAWV